MEARCQAVAVFVLGPAVLGSPPLHHNNSSHHSSPHIHNLPQLAAQEASLAELQKVQSSAEPPWVQSLVEIQM